jgi:hypothetical protein
LFYVSGCKKHEDQDKNGGYKYVGFYLRTDTADFFIADGDSGFFTDKEFIRIRPVEESWDPNADRVSFDSLNNGDKIDIEIETVGDLYPRVTQVYRYNLLEQGDISYIDESVIATLDEMGYKVVQ